MFYTQDFNLHEIYVQASFHVLNKIVLMKQRGGGEPGNEANTDTMYSEQRNNVSVLNYCWYSNCTCQGSIIIVQHLRPIVLLQGTVFDVCLNELIEGP